MFTADGLELTVHGIAPEGLSAEDAGITLERHGDGLRWTRTLREGGIGGERNWDYRYTWIRDGSFSIYALLGLGYVEETLDHFEGWRGSRPVRIGNGARNEPEPLAGGTT